MPKLRIKRRPNAINRTGYEHSTAPYPEFVFGDDLGGGWTFALGLDLAGEVRALVYLPPLMADPERAREMAIERLADYAQAATPPQVAWLRMQRVESGKLLEMPKVVQVKFSPFSMEGL